MGIFKKPLSEIDKQLWAIGLMGNNLKWRSDETKAAIGGAIGAGIAFSSQSSMVVSIAQAWEKTNKKPLPIRGLSDEDRNTVKSDYDCPRHLKAKKELVDVLNQGTELAAYRVILVLPTLIQDLVLPEFPEEYDWDEVDPAIRDLADFGKECLISAASAYMENKGKYGTDAFEFVLNTICYAGSVLRV